MSAEKRQLAAILFADIQGYTALMQEDEEKAFQMVGRFEQEINRLIKEYRGKVIQFYGDGALMLFDSAQEAVQCALDLQKSFRSDPEVPVRMGLNDGEVLLRDGNAFGDSINIASRIESIAIPGAILFSESIFDQIHNKKQFRSKKIGRFHFKNVNKEIDVHALTNDGLPVPDKSKVEGKLAEKKTNGLRRAVLASFVIVLLAVFIITKITAPPISSEQSALASWTGTWHQDVEGTDGAITGVLQIANNNGVLSGTARNQYGDMAMTTTNELYDIFIHEEGNTIAGKWRSKEWVQMQGSFTFVLMENKRSFNGHYTIAPDTTRFYWNGSRDQ